MPPQVGFKSLRLADSDSPEIPVQRVEQVVGFSREDRARHDALYAYCQGLEGGHTP